MKTLLGWLCDPYVHILVIGLILVRLAMGSGTEGSSRRATAQFCERCGDYHDGWNGQCRITAAVADLVEGQ